MGSSPSSRPDPGPRRDAVWAWTYRHRGTLAVLPVAYALIAAKPTREGLLAGALLMGAGEGLRLWAASHLGPTTRSSAPLAGKLVTRGPYAHTRHPLYLANLLLTLGYALAAGAGRPWFPALIAILFAGIYQGHARREEAALARAFPEEAAAYRTAVPALGWRLRPARVREAGTTGNPSLLRGLRVEAWTLHAEAWLWVLLWARTRFLPGL